MNMGTFRVLCVVLVMVSKCISGDCDLHCADSPTPGSCCERFYLNINRDSDIVISASSEWDPGHGPGRAGLFETEDPSATDGGIAGWASLSNNPNQWVQVDFGSSRHVTGVMLQGRGEGCCDQWVTSFRILYSNDRNTFYSTKTIEGTFDRHTVAVRYLERPIFARYYRINPVTWHGHVTLRFDLIGCKDE